MADRETDHSKVLTGKESVVELEAIIERQFTDETTPMRPELIDAAIRQLLLLSGHEPTPETLQEAYTQTAYKYLRRSLGLEET